MIFSSDIPFVQAVHEAIHMEALSLLGYLCQGLICTLYRVNDVLGSDQAL